MKYATTIIYGLFIFLLPFSLFANLYGHAKGVSFGALFMLIGCAVSCYKYYSVNKKERERQDKDMQHAIALLLQYPFLISYISYSRVLNEYTKTPYKFLFFNLDDAIKHIPDCTTEKLLEYWTNRHDNTVIMRLACLGLSEYTKEKRVFSFATLVG